MREEPRSPGAGPAVVRGRYSQDAIAEEALAFLQRHRGEPFFLYLPFTIPHAELQAPDDAYGPYVKDGRSIFPETPFAEQHYGAQAMPHATYAAMVTRLDRDVGRVLDTLAALGLDRDTVVFFTSDNGPSVEGGSDPVFFRSSGGLRGIKRDVYEGGVRVPMIVRWPGRVPAGRTSDHVWALWDVMPTLAELAERRRPRGSTGSRWCRRCWARGRSGRTSTSTGSSTSRARKQAVRADRWKGVRQPMLTGRLELYDLEKDPAEAHDVAAAHPDVAARLGRLMDQAHTPSPIWKAPAEETAR